MAYLVSDLINSSLRLIGVLASGETPSTDESADALVALNSMLAEWNTQHLAVFAIDNFTKVLSANVGAYTIGTGGAINTARPLKIASAGITQSNGLRSPLALIGQAEWDAVAEKTVSAVQPLQLYNDNAYPLATINLWPRPSGTPTLDLFLWHQIAAFATIGDTVDFPPGYLKTLRFNLALDLAPEYGREIPPVVLATAQSTKAELAGLNASNLAGSENPAPAADVVKR